MKITAHLEIKVDGSATDEEVKDWLKFRLGLRGDLLDSNPLSDIEFDDAKIHLTVMNIRA